MTTVMETMAHPSAEAEAEGSTEGAAARLIARWAPGTGLAGLLLLLMTPMLSADWSPALTAAWLCLPAYMIHQYEEHDGGRFGAYVNDLFGKGREALTPEAIFVINVPVVWSVIALAFGFAAAGQPDAALGAIYLVFLNGLLHVAQVFALGRSNPGIWTSILLFLPIGAYGLAVVPADLSAHVSAVLLVVLLHLSIVIQVRGRMLQGGGVHGA